MIKLLIFDLTGVVVDGGHRVFCRQLSEKYNIPMDNLYEEFYTNSYNLLAINKISEQDAYELAAKKFGLKETWEELAQMYLDTYSLKSDTYKFISELKNNYTTILLTKNFPRYIECQTKQFKLNDIFKEIINTFDLGLPKASEETMNYVLDRYSVKPDETIYIDDQQENLLSAKKLGVHTIYFENFEQFKHDLNKLL